MFKSLLTITALSLSLSAFAQMSEAEKAKVENKLEGTLPESREATRDEYKVHMGLSAGVNSPNGDVESSPEFGVNVGFQPYIPFGFGGELVTSEINDTNIQRTSLLARGTYNFGGDIPVLRSSFIGVAAGPMWINFDGDNNDEVEWSAGPLAGFDIPLKSGANSDYLSLGLQAKYLYTTDSEDALSAGLALKYWY